MLLFDLETNGLLEKVSKIHCLVIKDARTSQTTRCYNNPKAGDWTISDGLRLLSDATHMGIQIGGHNIIKYDLPVIQKLYPWFTFDRDLVFDTLVATRLIYTNLKTIDAGLLKKKRIPGTLYGSHKLEAWGYRMNLQKGEYADEWKAAYIAAWGEDAYEEGMEWQEFSEDMLDYCVLDVEVTHALYLKIAAKNYSAVALELEHKVAWLMAQQERNGFMFNVTEGAVLYAKLAQRRGELERNLREFFRFWFAPAGKVISKRTCKVFHADPSGPVVRKVKGVTQRGSYEFFEKDAPYTKLKLVEFNPASRDHIADRLQKLYSWVPIDFTDGGKPKVDEEVMKHLTYEPCALLTEYLLVAKRISQLAEGDQAWLKVERKGFIHGSVNTNGAVTGRATHAYPNMGQVPSCTSPFGHECRELFGVPPGWVLVGADASGLELRCLAHFMARYDGGKYIKLLLEGDVHTANQLAAGLPSRANAKTFIYAFLYGAGDEKIGRIVNKDKLEGKRLKAQFLRKTPALKRLIDDVKDAAKRGYLKGLDGRDIHIRYSHAALNSLLQSAGAVLCKKWLVLLEEDLAKAGLKHGWDGDFAFCAWVHDEVQIACRTPEIAELVSQLATACVAKAGESFNFRCPLAGEAKTGRTWAETH